MNKKPKASKPPRVYFEDNEDCMMDVVRGKIIVFGWQITARNARTLARWLSSAAKYVEKK